MRRVLVRSCLIGGRAQRHPLSAGVGPCLVAAGMNGLSVAGKKEKGRVTSPAFSHTVLRTQHQILHSA